MVEKKSYYELLKHPLWQRKRLEVLQRAGFACESCGTSDETLHVHHSYYEKGLAPWEYPDLSLHCLCERCHKEAQDQLQLLHRQLGRLDATDIPRLIGYALGLETGTYPNTVVDVFSYEVAQGLGDSWALSAEEIIGVLQEGQIDGWKLSALSRARRGLPPIDAEQDAT